MSFEFDDSHSLYEIHGANDLYTMPPASPPTPPSASEMVLDPRLRSNASDLSLFPTSTSERTSFIYPHGHSNISMSPAGFGTSTDEMKVTAIEPHTFTGHLDLTPDFLSFYKDHDPGERYARCQEDITTGIVSLIFNKSIIGSNGPISSLDLARSLKYRNRGHAEWDSITEGMVETAFFKLSTAEGMWHETFMCWQNLFDKDCTGDNSDEFKQVKAKLLADLESAEALLRSATIDDPQAIVNRVKDEECLGGEHFEIVEEDYSGEDTEWMLLAP